MGVKLARFQPVLCIFCDSLTSIKNYHGWLGKKLEIDILSNPDAVYVSGNKSQNLIYRKV